MRGLFSNAVRAVLLAMAVIVLQPSISFAQRGGGSTLDQLQDGDVQAELKLSDQQLQQLDALRDEAGDRSGFVELMKKSAKVKDEAERAKLREQMKNYAANRRAEAEAKLKGVLTPEQLTRLDQVRLQRRGLRALADNDIAASMKLTDDQKAKIAQLLEEQQTARRDELGRDASDEDRTAFQEKWNAKIAGVLNDEQKQVWAEKIGPPQQGGGEAAIASSPNAATPQRVMDAPPPEGAETTASFGAPPAKLTTGETSSQNPTGDDKLFFNFRYAPWSEVLPLFAEAADLTLDLNTIPPGTFNHYDDDGYTVTEALDVLNGYLLARGYVLVRRDRKFLVCVNIDDGIPPNLVPTVTIDELPDRGRNELMTVIFPLQGVDDVDAIASEVEKLKGPQGTVVGITPTRSLVVTDIGSNLARIHQLLRNVTGGPEDLVFKEYALQHILADDAEILVRTLLGLSLDNETSSKSAAAQANNNQQQNTRFSRFGGGFPFGGPRPTPAPTSAGSSNRSNSKANTIADPRTNKLLVSATSSEHRIIEEALKTIDVAELSPLASDRPYGSLGDKQMAVIPLANMDPTSGAIMLQSMFLKEGEDAPTINADLISRQLIIRGTEAQLYQIRELLKDLGEDGTGQRSVGNRGPVRTVNLSGRDPNELLPILERMWEAQRGSKLRVIVPADAANGSRSRIHGDDDRRQSPERPQTKPPARPQPSSDRPLPPPEDDDRQARYDRLDRGNIFTVGAEVEQPQAAEPRVQSVQTEATPSGITVRVIGGELILMSQDEQALDDLELMLEQALTAVPPRTTWSIFPLKQADATEAAAMLEQLFPDSRVSQMSSSSSGTLGALTSGISSFGSGVASMTGLSDLGTGPLTLRIIPETRLNALWVAGPAYKVAEVEEMLSIIDSSGLTESLRDRLPRLIPVMHADIGDVYEIVSSVYAPEMQSSTASGGAGGQALAAMFGGGRRGGGGDDDDKGASTTGPQITLGVDHDTSHLIVSADEGTFREIEELVQSIDKAAESSRRTVAVRPLVNTNASMIQNSLTTLMPKVTVSTSTSRSRPTTSSSSSSNNRSSGTPAAGGGATPQDIQQRIEMFRQLRGQGGGGGGPFGGGGRGGDSGGSGGRRRGGGRGR